MDYFVRHVILNKNDIDAKWWQNYRRKPVVFDKWAKEKATFTEGKNIQTNTKDGSWYDIINPLWLEDEEYRIKPEPVYTHFNYDDHATLLGKVVINKGGDKGAAIITHCTEFTLTAGETQLLYEEALELLLFADGSPFGKQL